ncbi:MAG TPA: hypothetical protein VGH91_05190 [Gammaproteobacteria bacterium]|jgi:hypothetical protein
MNVDELSLADDGFSDRVVKQGIIERSFLLKPEGVSPYQAYSFLKETFGQPNSDEFDDMKTQWQYALQSSDAYYEIYDWKVFTWSIGVYLREGAKKSGEELANELFKLFKAGAAKGKNALKEKLKHPDGLVIENPFFTYRETADSLYELLIEMQEPKKDEAGHLEFHHWWKHYDLCRAAFIMYLSSVEGFINLLYELYLRKSLREKRIYDRIYREQIDLKIRLAPLYCECFSENVLDANSEEFKKFHSLVNLRNDLVHANLTKPMMSPVIYEDDIEFVIEVDSETTIGVPASFREFESRHVELAKTITGNLIKYVIASMRPRFRKEFSAVMDDELIKVVYEDEQIYIA